MLGKWVAIPAAAIVIAASLLGSGAGPASASLAAASHVVAAHEQASHPALTPTITAPVEPAWKKTVQPAKLESPATLGQSIASIAEAQEGYLDSPPDGYCNKYSGAMGSGTVCGTGLRDDYWCADFAAWVWRDAGIAVDWGSGSAQINGAAASFLRWGRANGEYHALSSSYTPQPGDVAIFGSGSSVAHVAIVVGGSWNKPNVVNGDWYTTNPGKIGVYYQAAETSNGAGADLEGYVSPPGASSATVPSAPTGVSATAGGQGYATISWQPPASDGGSAITGYTVTSSPAAVSLSYSASDTTITLDGLATGVSYTFTVTASNAAGTSGASAPSNAVTPYTWPNPPPITSVVSGNGQATVYFDAPASDGYSPVTYYEVTAGLYGSETGETETGTASPITVTGLTNGDSYWVYVVAYNAGGNSASSPVDGTATPLDQGAPPSDVYMADQGANEVVEITTSGQRETIGSGLSAPHAVAVDSADDVFIADTGNNRVVEIAPNGTQTVVGTGFNSPEGVAVDGNGDVFVADTGNNRVVEIGPHGTQAVFGSGFSGPEAVAVDGSGDVWVADTGNDRVVGYASGSDTPSWYSDNLTLAANYLSGELPSATPVASDALGDQYSVDASGRLLMWAPNPDGDGGSQVTIASGLSGAAGLSVWSPPPAPGWVDQVPGDNSVQLTFQPPASMVDISPVTSYTARCTDLTTPANGTVTVAQDQSPVTITGLVNGDNYNCQVAALNVVGTGPGKSSGVVTPTAPGTPSANIYYPDDTLKRVLEVPAASGVPTQVLASGLTDPEAVAVDRQGDVYVTDDDAVDRYAPGSTTPTVVVSGLTLFGIALDAAGNLYVGGSTTGLQIGVTADVWEYPADGGAPKVVATDSKSPQALAVDPKGDIFIADTGDIVEQSTGGGAPVTLATDVLAAGIAADGNGNIYYTNLYDPSDVMKMSLATGIVTTVGSGFSYPESVAVDSAGNVYVNDNFNDRIVEVPADGDSEFTVASTTNEAVYGLAVQTPAVPGTPIITSLSPDDASDSATLFWNAPSSDGASAITGYVVSAATASGTVIAPPVQVPGTTQAYTFHDVPTGQQVVYSVEAENTDGAGGGASASTTVTALPGQAITFTAPQAGTVGGTAQLKATGGGSGNPVTFTVDSTTAAGVCALSGTDGTTVTYSGTGACVIDARQAGSSDYQSASQVQRVITVGAASQALTVTAPATGTFGGRATLSGTGGGSRSPVVFSVDPSSWAGTCAVSGTTVSYTGVGTCVIDANQAGTANYTAAPQVQKVITVSPASQQISLTAPSSGTVGGSSTLSAKGGASGNPVTFTIDKATKSGICSVSGATLSFQGAGTCVVDADQASNASRGNAATYSAAPQVQREITVKKAATKTALTLSTGTVEYGHEQSDKFTVAVTFTGSAPAPTGTVTIKEGSTTLCAVKLSSGRGSCTLSASRLKVGAYHLTAAYGGGANFTASTGPSKTLTVKKA